MASWLPAWDDFQRDFANFCLVVAGRLARPVRVHGRGSSDLNFPATSAPHPPAAIHPTNHTPSGRQTPNYNHVRQRR